MTQLQKYTWLIDTIRQAGKISLEELSARWERCKDLSDCRPLSRATFNRWKDAIFSQFGILISCQRIGGYLYYIENPEAIDEDRLKKWMLDS
ncbi:MAG: WYL domain-containing protein, partial [Odoribacter sp.]|nr:WYL domain-containing protein [Odoribacter sp.]